MAKISVQLHGTTEELVGFASQTAKEDGVQIVAVRLIPDFMLERIVDLDDEEFAARSENIDMILFCNSQPDLSAENTRELMDRNPDGMMLRIGRMKDNELRGSVLSARTDNEASLGVWREIAKKLRAITSAGAWVVNPNTGARTYSKKHRYTEGAKCLEAGGTRMKPVAGWNTYNFGDRP